MQRQMEKVPVPRQTSHHNPGGSVGAAYYYYYYYSYYSYYSYYY